jgi:peptide/nickel transport system ATP-binding protein
MAGVDTGDDIIEVLQRPADVVAQYSATGTAVPGDCDDFSMFAAAIARAIINRPNILVLDEPVSALDIGVRSQILDLLDDLRRRYGLAMVFITHDLGVARGIANYLVVMQRGRVVEEGATATVLADPKQAYTRALVEASPALNHKVFAPRTLGG